MALKISQAELARRVGVRQSSMNALIRGDSRTSRHLHVIARVLGTTPAYLSGETDDPDEGAPPEPTVSREERELLDDFAGLDPDQKTAIRQVIKSMATKPTKPTIHDPRPEYRSEEERR